MKRTHHLVFLQIAIICVAIFLVGCGQKNPLLRDQYVNTLKGELDNLRFLETEAYKPTINCPPYLAKPATHPGLKNQCDQWAGQIYRLIMNKGELPVQTTLEQFKDPALWQVLQPK